MVDLLIKNGLILTMDESLSIIKGSIAVEDGKIRKVGKNFGGQAEEVLDAEGKIVMPGLVLPHCHFQNVLQGLEREEDISPPGWSPFEEFLTREEISTATTFSCACLLSSGVTFAVNILSLKAISSGLLDEVFTKEEEMGMKGLIAVEIWDDEEVDGSKALREEEKLLRKNDSKRIEPLISVRAYSSDEILDCVRDLLAERENLRLSVRISKTPAEYYYCRSKTGESPLQRLHRQGLIDGRTVLTHFTYRVEEEDLKIIRRSEAKIVHTPLDYVYTHTFPAVKSVDEMGIKGSVGMDHPFDLFEILRMIYLHQRAIGEHISASRLLQMVTKEAAELYGIRDIGSIEVGKSADLLIVNLPPLRDESIYEHLLWSLTGQRVETVISSGRILKREGKPCWDELKVNREFARMMSLLRRKIRHGVAGS